MGRIQGLSTEWVDWVQSHKGEAKGVAVVRQPKVLTGDPALGARGVEEAARSEGSGTKPRLLLLCQR